MTSLVSKDDIENELYKLAGPHKAALIPRVMQVIDKYAISMSRKMGDLSVGWHPDARYLRPGETDEQAGKRRCLGCGKIRDLTREFARDHRMPNGRRRRCLECSPDNHLVRDYWCPGCKGRLPIHKFGVKKKKNPQRVYLCLVCEQQRK
jgi:hypothetical protein